ncbi:hypothetical protein HDU91_005730, partial [Kappamyces sp. JEL0680]
MKEFQVFNFTFLIPLIFISIIYLAPKPSETVFYRKLCHCILPFYPFLPLHLVLFALVFFALLLVHCVVSVSDFWNDGEYPRYAYLSLQCLVLAPLFGMRNSPLVYLGIQFDHMLPLHILYSTTAILLAGIHSFLYLKEWLDGEVLYDYLFGDEVMSAVPVFGLAGIALFALNYLAALPIVRRLFFRLFKLVHVVVYPVILICLGLHTPVCLPYLLPAFVFWSISTLSTGLDLATPCQTVQTYGKPSDSSLQLVVTSQLGRDLRLPKPGQYYLLYHPRYGSHPISVITHTLCSDENRTLVLDEDADDEDQEERLVLEFEVDGTTKFAAKVAEHGVQSISGPLGNAFDCFLDAKGTKLCVGGGIGIT